MGYEIIHAKSTVKIPLKYINEISTILKNYPSISRETYEDFKDADIIELFFNSRYESYIDIEKQEIHVTDIIHEFKWHWDEEKLWSDLAPYIEDNTYIGFFAEDGEAWRYGFIKGVIIIQYIKEVLMFHRYEIIDILKKSNETSPIEFFDALEWIL